MKTFFIRILVVILFLSGAEVVQAQGMQGAVTGSVGFLVPKFRFGYESPPGVHGGIGLLANLYVGTWQGIYAEPFIRFYPKDNSTGFFGQFKAGFGSFKVYDYESFDGGLTHSHWTASGYGMGFGHKYYDSGNFIVETYFGFRYISQPYYKYKNGTVDNVGKYGSSLNWKVGPGFPFQVYIMVGYQFRKKAPDTDRPVYEL